MTSSRPTNTELCCSHRATSGRRIRQVPSTRSIHSTIAEEDQPWKSPLQSKWIERAECARPLCGLVLALWAGVAGCRQSDSLPNLKVYEVKGKVLLADGKPLTNGWVYFVPKGELTVTPSAIIGSDGTFSLITGGSGEGVPAGDYKIRIETPGFQPAQKSKKGPFPSKYTDEDSSGIVITVRPEANQLEPFLLN